MTPEEAYRLLELAPPVTAQAVKLAYRRKAMESHPDRHPDDERSRWEARFMAAHRAYAFLRERGFPELQDEPLPEPDFGPKVGGRSFAPSKYEDAKLADKLGIHAPWSIDTMVLWGVGLPLAAGVLVYFLRWFIQALRGG